MEINNEMEKEVLSKYKLPIYFDRECGQMFDQEGEMVAQVRSWGYLQKFPNAEKLQDTLGEMIAKAFNEKYTK